MIPQIALSTLLAAACVGVYFPAKHDASHYRDLHRHTVQQELSRWPHTAMDRIHRRAEGAAELVRELQPVTVGQPTVHPPTALREMEAAGSRLFKSQYFQDLAAMLDLACFRMALQAEWLAWLSPFGLAAMVDASMLRNIRSREFRAHSPESFAAYAAIAALMLSSMALLSLAPVTLPWWTGPATSVAMLAAIGRAWSTFHRQEPGGG